MPDTSDTKPVPQPLPKRGGNKTNHQWDAGAWPDSPPFTILGQRKAFYYNAGYLAEDDWQRMGGMKMDWLRYLADNFGEGIYIVKGYHDGPGRGPVSRFEVKKAYAERIRAQQAPAREPDEYEANPPEDSVDSLLAHEEKMAKLRKALGVDDNPPSPSPFEQAIGPIMQNVVPAVMKVLTTRPPGPQQPAQASLPLETNAQAWLEVGKLYESIGWTPQAVQQYIAHQRALAQAQAAQVQAKPGE